MCFSCLRSLQSNRTKETQKNVDTYVHPDAKEQDTQVDQNEAVEEAKDVQGGHNETELPDIALEGQNEAGTIDTHGGQIEADLEQRDIPEEQNDEQNGDELGRSDSHPPIESGDGSSKSNENELTLHLDEGTRSGNCPIATIDQSATAPNTTAEVIPGQEDVNENSNKSHDKQGDDRSSSSSSESSSSSSSSSSKSDTSGNDPFSKKEPKFNSLYLSPHSIGFRFSQIEDKECATRAEWNDQYFDREDRNRKQTQRGMSWLVNMQDKDIPVKERANYDAGSGRLGFVNQDASHSLFARPKGLLQTQGERRLSDVELFGESHAMGDLWLKEPLTTLHQSIVRSHNKKETRSMTDDLKSGNDLQLASSEIPALDVINMNHDDIELISYGVTNGTAGKLWHSPRFVEDGMLSRAILSVFRNTDDVDLPEPIVGDKTEFLGFTEVHKNRDNQIMAFNITAMLLFTENDDEIEISSAIVARDMGNSSMLERLIQCLQVLQMRRNTHLRGTSKIKINIPKNAPGGPRDPNYSNYHATIAYKLGF